MIRFLQRLKAKKGFTIIELIVVIAILGVLMAVILPSISQQRSRINEARSAAKDFYAAVQTVMNNFSVFDGQLLPDDSKDSDVIHYYRNMGGNYPFDPDPNGHSESAANEMGYPDQTVMYIMVHAKNRNIEEIGIVTKEKNKNNSDNGMFQLLKRDPADRNTKFADILKRGIKDRVSFNDGYYYAKVDFEYPSGMDIAGEPIDAYMSTIKVEYTAFCRKELPDLPYDGFLNALTFGTDYVLNWNGEICGTCASRNGSDTVGYAGTTLT